VYRKIRSQGAYSVDDSSGLAEPIGKPAPYDRPGIGGAFDRDFAPVARALGNDLGGVVSVASVGLQSAELTYPLGASRLLRHSFDQLPDAHSFWGPAGRTHLAGRLLRKSQARMTRRPT